jgi:heavy metal sensor kinase
MNFAALTKSIRWRLLTWMAVLLGLMLVALGIAACEIFYSNRVNLLDQELRRRMAALSGALFGPMRRGGFNQPPRGPPGDFDGGPQPDEFPLALPPGGPGPQGPQRFESTPMEAATKAYEAAASNGFYYVVWRTAFNPLTRHSTNAPAEVPQPQLGGRDTGTYTRTREGFREVFHETEMGDCLLIGRSLAPEQAEGRRFAGWVGLGGAVVLALGLGGAWIIIARALRPVQRISGAAAKIAAGDLSQRIGVAETDSELGQLAAVLNSTFGRLEAAFERQKQFTADAAHELRTPVAVLLVHAQNGLASGCASEEHREAFEACQRAAQRMKVLIGALLELARLDAGQDESKRTRFDLAQTVRQAIELIQPLADERQVKIVAELPALEVFGNAEQLAQVAANLLTNAVQYNHPQGEVRLKLERRDHTAVLTVSDTGVGISADDLPRIFERFYRADKSRSSAAGLGLGLAISKAIVEAHGGTIEVASQEEAGSTFMLRLPLQPANG